MEFRPIDIAKKLDVGTSALRHYEEWGIVPPAKRKANGYRIYTEEHEAYFQCIRAMYHGFGMGTVKKIMPMIQQNKFTEALWEVNKVQAELYQKKQQAIEALEILKPDNMENFLKKRKKQWYTIGEVEKEIEVPATTLRHWEKEGLIEPSRDPENGYRIYNREHIQQALIIRTVQQSVYFLDSVRSVLEKMDQYSISEIRKITMDSLEYMDYQIEQQLRGGHYLYKLIELLKKKERTES
ncbi:MerR family transcriptional regulator [Pallidibacillus thermolactis]|jgi:DNA-binding transcriptional MerR regulator|uniref:MerR family transcriptional regulator n=1 Tax=Pallidibacillus thermolactis TaxID=251051 RepID=UPI0021DA6C36|nr:MerR family transcriptional regulator [Pallidibacillus thermolactis]MCU9602114.1 MerR family transcriptional regulator [Pallidibacillus thermolactis subsp. kokeshiiformis]